jgi:3-hydroxyisobutyrate dehydrogenase-like beta-hydroxyacid dehydrogenase
MTPTPTIGTPAALVLYSGPEAVFQAHRDTLAGIGGTATYLGADPGRAAAYDTALLDMFWLSVLGIVHGLAMAGADGISGAELAPYATGLFGLLPEMMTRFAKQADEGHYPGERSTVASAASGLAHLTHTARRHGIDAGILTASEAVLGRALAEGHGADGLSRLVAMMRLAS